jgi:hypothetical protein
VVVSGRERSRVVLRSMIPATFDEFMTLTCMGSVQTRSVAYERPQAWQVLCRCFSWTAALLTCHKCGMMPPGIDEVLVYQL